MPSPTRTPDPPAAVGQDTPPGPWLIEVPAGWPPYDCDSHGAACPAARKAATPAPRPAEPSGPARRGVPPPAPGAPAGTGTPAGTGAAAGWAGQFAQVIVEILAGARPPRQIVPWTTERVRAQVDGLARLFTADQRPRIRRVVTSRPSASVVEMTVVVSSGPRSRALAMRFEHVPARRPAPGLPARPARWLCTDMEMG